MSKPALRHSITGFTLVELLVVIVIAGVLAAIAAPGWLSFANSRRADAGRDQVLQLLRQAQSQATQSRQAKIVNFITPTNNLPSIQIAGIDQRIDGQVPNVKDSKLFGLKVINGNVAGCEGSATSCVIFDDRGNVKRPNNDLGSGIKVVVTSPADNAGSRRCVIVKTLLGAMEKGKGAACD